MMRIRSRLIIALLLGCFGGLCGGNVVGQELKPDDVQPGQGRKARIASAHDDMFIEIQTPVYQIYAGETLRIEYDVYVATHRGQVFYDVEEPEFLDWYSVEGIVPAAGMSSFESKSFAREPFAVFFVTPYSVGKLALPALKVQVPFLNGKPWITHDTRYIEVIDLPSPRPAGFSSGNVGKFELNSQISSDHVKKGDLVLVSIHVKGHSPVSGISLAPYQLKQSVDAFKVYPIQLDTSRELAGRDALETEKTFTLKLLALQAGRWTLDPFELITFDPREHQYKTYRSVSHVIDVEDSDKVIDLNPPRAKSIALEDISIHDIVLKKTRFTKPISLWWLLLAPGLLFAGYAGIVLNRYRRRMTTKDESRKRLNLLFEQLTEAKTSDAQMNIFKEVFLLKYGIELKNSENGMRQALTAKMDNASAEILIDIIRAIKETSYSTKDPVKLSRLKEAIDILMNDSDRS